ncbi:MAG: hypothetical protein KDA85_02875, partial [Planctomycetaceae bacterium]|nr:hypothetical protein [Planctomycetaceae bacterium]
SQGKSVAAAFGVAGFWIAVSLVLRFVGDLGLYPLVRQMVLAVMPDRDREVIQMLTVWIAQLPSPWGSMDLLQDWLRSVGGYGFQGRRYIAWSAADMTFVQVATMTGTILAVILQVGVLALIHRVAIKLAPRFLGRIDSDESAVGRRMAAARIPESMRPNMEIAEAGGVS